MNEELLQEIKKTLPWLLVAALAVGGYYWIKDHRQARAVAASETAVAATLTDELEEAAADFKGAKTEGVLKIRLAKSYFDAGRYEDALALYEELMTAAPKGLEDVPAVGKAACLEALGKFDDAFAAYEAFATTREKSFLVLTAQLGAARSLAQKGEKAKAIERLTALQETVKDNEMSKARVEATIDLVKRYEKRAATSLFDAANDAAKQIEGEKAAGAVKTE